MIRILVADDQSLVRGALVALLNLEPDLEVVAEVGRGDEVLAAVHQHHPEVVLMDVQMPGMDGLAAAAELMHHPDPPRVLVVTTFGRPGFLTRAMRAGVSGFVVKDTPADQLAEAVRRVHAGLRVIDPGLAAESVALGESPFTPREAEVLQAAQDGAPVATIAQRVHLSEGTVRNHLSSVMAKTSTGTRAEAVRVAIDRGWILG